MTQAFRILMLINHTKLTEKAMQLFNSGKLPVHLQFSAHGTANSDMLDILGLGGIEKDVMFSIVPKTVADEMLRRLYTELELSQKNSGIAFTMPLSGINSMFAKISERLNPDITEKTTGEGLKHMSEMKYSLIAATVNQGFSEEVINAARAAGAKGGTCFHTNGAVNENNEHLWGTDFQEEKETVLIIADNESKLGIMQAISHSCGINTEAQGIVVSMPIDNIMGLSAEESLKNS